MNYPRKVESNHTLMLALLPPLYVMTQKILGKGYGFAMKCLKAIYRNKLAFVHFSDGSRFYFNLGDSYWNRLVIPGFQYEPELAGFLYHIRDMNYVFLDAGANLGYWSVLVSSQLLGDKKVIAIEASDETFKMLEMNCNKNDGRFSIHHRAIFNENDKTLSFSTGAHAARHIDTSGSDQSELVVAITLDHLADLHDIPEEAPTVIKLDVEGAEIPAMQGAHKLLERDTLLIFEDHGKDRKHETTRYVMENLDLDVFFISGHEENLKARKIRCVDELDKIKTNPKMGYNFFAAHSSSTFYDILASLCKQPA